MTGFNRSTVEHLLRSLLPGLTLLAAATSLHAEEVEVLWADPKCEMIFVKKSDGEFGTVLRLNENLIEAGDRLEGDFAYIDQIRKVKNVTRDEEIMVRGVRYSSSRKWVLRVLPKWCKGPTE